MAFYRVRYLLFYLEEGGIPFKVLGLRTLVPLVPVAIVTICRLTPSSTHL